MPRLVGYVYGLPDCQVYGRPLPPPERLFTRRRPPVTPRPAASAKPPQCCTHGAWGRRSAPGELHCSDMLRAITCSRQQPCRHALSTGCCTARNRAGHVAESGALTHDKRGAAASSGASEAQLTARAARKCRRLARHLWRSWKRLRPRAALQRTSRCAATAADGDPVYMSRQIRKFRTDKFDT